MTHHSKISNIAIGSVLAFGSVITPSVLIAAPTFAEGDNASKSVYVNYSAGSTGEDLYVETGCKSNAANTATYCANGQNLTLNNYSGDEIYIFGIEDNVTLTLKGTNTLTPSANTNTLVSNPYGSLTINGEGTLKASNAPTLFSIKKETIMNSGNIEFTTTNGTSHIFYSDAAMTVNGGTIRYNVPAPEEKSEFSFVYHGSINTGDFVMNGGSLVAPNVVLQPGSGSRNSFSLKDGSINVFAAEGKSIEIAGGEFTSDSPVRRNSLSAETTLAFNGGKTTLKQPVSSTVFAVAAADQITFATNMCVTGDAHLENQGSKAFLAMGQNDTVVIQQGTCGNNPFPGGNPTPDPTPTDDGGGIKAPNTGFEASKAILATIIAVPAIIAATILGRYFYRRYSHRVSFKK